jgi:hypothetical protein
MRTSGITLTCLVPLLLLPLGSSCGLSRGESRPAFDREERRLPPLPPGEQPREEPSAFEGRGKLICLAEEMRELYGVEIAPIHEHQLGFRLDAPAPGAPRYYGILRTSVSEGLFTEDRFRQHTLELRGRRFPASALIEINRYRWLREGKLYEVFYWCEVCSIRGTDPGPCACCQGAVELREVQVAAEEP